MALIFISHSWSDNGSAQRIKDSLAESGLNYVFLDFDRDDGPPPGVDWEHRLYQEIERCQAVVLVLSPSWVGSKWCFAEYTQARALGKTIFPVIVRSLDGHLIARDLQHIDLTKAGESELSRLTEALSDVALDVQAGFRWDIRRSPYPGLLSFEEDDAAIFFGRSDDVRRVIERLNARRVQGARGLIVLLGASGCGKSSLLKAGVLPRLKRDKNRWIVFPAIRPQVVPAEQLAQATALALGDPNTWQSWRDRLTANPAQAIVEIAFTLRARANALQAKIVLAIDQGEELFSTVAQSDRLQFFKILDALAENDSPFICLMALRSDALAQLQTSTDLSASCEELSLRPLPLSRIPQVIEGPARVVGLKVETGLLYQAMHDAETDDALPLLAFALREMYERFGSSGALTLAGYQSLGEEKLSPLENAVRQKADEVIAAARPTEDEIIALRDALIPAMVGVSRDGNYERRPTSLQSLPAAARPLLERLTAARLLVVYSERGASARIEVAHEALLRNWPLLRRWLDTQRDFMLAKVQFDSSFSDWSHTAPDAKSDALLHGLQLERARNWLIETPQRLTPAEQDFVRASIDHVEADQRRRRRQRRIVAAGAIVLVAALAVLSAVTTWQWLLARQATRTALASENSALINASKAERERDRATKAERVAVQQRNAVETTVREIKEDARVTGSETVNPARLSRLLSQLARPECDSGNAGAGLALAIEAAELSPNISIHPKLHSGSIYQCLREIRETRVWPSGHETGRIRTLFNKDATKIISFSSQESSFTLWDTQTGTMIRRVKSNEQELLNAAVSAQHDLLATASKDGTAKIWQASTGALIQTLPHGAVEVHQVQFDVSGTHLLTRASDGAVRVWNSASGSLIKTLRSKSGQKYSEAKLSSDGSIVAAIVQTPLDDELIEFWRAHDEEAAPFWVVDLSGKLFAPMNITDVHDATADFSPDGSKLAVSFGFGDFSIIDLLSRTTTLLDGQEPHGRFVSETRFSPSGDVILTYSSGDTVGLWDARTGKVLGSLVGHNGEILAAEFSPSGKFVMSASEDSTIRIWDVQTTSLIAELKGHRGPVVDATFTEDERHIASISIDGTLRLWSFHPGSPLRLGDDFSKQSLRGVKLSPDGLSALSENEESEFQLWDLRTAKIVTDFGQIQEDDPNTLSLSDRLFPTPKFGFNEDGRYIFINLAGQGYSIWDTRSGNRVAPFGPSLEKIERLSLSREFVVTCSDKSTWELWRLADGFRVGQLQIEKYEPPIECAAAINFNATEERIVVNDYVREQVLMFDSKSAALIAKIPDKFVNLPDRQASYRSAKNVIITVSKDGTEIHAWNASTGKQEYSDDHIREVAEELAHCGPYVRQRIKGTWPGDVSGAGLRREYLSPDCQYIVEIAPRDEVHIRRGSDGIAVGQIPLPAYRNAHVEFCNHCGRAIVQYQDYFSRRTNSILVSLDSGSEIQRFPSASLFHPGGWSLVAMAADGAVGLWDTDSGELLASVEDYAPSDQPLVEFSAQGEIFAVISPMKRTASIWRLPVNDYTFLEFAKGVAPRCLTREERERFFLPGAPPDWCIDGGKWPYHTDAWRLWLSEKRAGRPTLMPN